MGGASRLSTGPQLRLPVGRHNVDDADMTGPDFLRHLAIKHGVFLRREALALGYDDRTIGLALRSGRWTRVRHGAYTFADLWPTNEVERHLLRCRAVMRVHGDRVVLSHQSSAVVRGVDTWGLDLTRSHVTRLDGRPARKSRDIAYHEGVCPPSDYEVIEGLRVTTMPRAVLETAIISPVEVGLVLADSALHEGLVTPTDLADAFNDMKGWPGTQHAQLVLRLADGRSGSVGETRSRFLMWSQGIPLPDLQFDVRAPNGEVVATTDFAWRKQGLLGEFDGKGKYTRLLRPGETPGDAVFREKQREDLIRELTGWRVVRLVWADLYRPELTAARIRASLRMAA